MIRATLSSCLLAGCLFILASCVNKKPEPEVSPIAEVNKGIDCRCSNPDGSLGEYTCINGKEYRCRNNVHDVCEWQLTNRNCGETELNGAEFSVTTDMLKATPIDLVAVDSKTIQKSSGLTMPNTATESKACAGQWTNFYCYKQGKLYILPLGRTTDCAEAYKILKSCVGTIDNDTVYCNVVMACAPYTICNN